MEAEKNICFANNERIKENNKTSRHYCVL